MDTPGKKIYIALRLSGREGDPLSETILNHAFAQLVGVRFPFSYVDINNVWPITFVEQWSLSELTVELATSCYAGVLMLQAMGLGGWMFNGVDPFAVMGASGNTDVPGLGFRYDTDGRWPYPNPTGLKGVMEGYCPPHYADMRAAVEAVCERKFGLGGPFHSETPGAWKDSRKVRSAAQVHDEKFRRCVAHQAQYVYDQFGKFPGTVPSMFLIMYLQAHHLDLEFYDEFFKPGSCLTTHANHMKEWHPPEWDHLDKTSLPAVGPM